jgi:adenylate cyclase
MLEVALHNPRQHKQFRGGPGPLVLARIGHKSALWTAADRGANRSDSFIEIVPQRTGISLALAGCEAVCVCGSACERTGNCQLPLPASFMIGDTRFEITLGNRAVTGRKLQRLSNDKRDLRDRKSSVAGPSPDTLSRWFAALSSLNHWATSLQQLYVQAARCAVEAIGLDGGIVLRRRSDDWEIASSHLPHPELGVRCDVAALDELLTTPQTLFHGASDGEASGEPAIVLSPLRNAAGELAGAVYGYRSVRAGNARRTIRYLEAHMIELLAGAVSEGIARIERETETDRRRVLLEHAVIANCNQRPIEMATDEREVTMLFADLRNSTGLSTSLDPNETYELMSQVTECLTAAVIEHDGLIIDYYGDGLAAMWNAPADQSDHAELACRAALRMLQSLPEISSDWTHVIERELELGIGVHTGVAHVGNTGSRHRTKYGPRGTNVNLTSRIEAATKQLGIPLVVTKATASRLSNCIAAHRICRAQMPGFDERLDLYSLGSPTSDAGVTNAWQAYGAALERFERGQMQEAASVLETIDANVREVPARFLATHLQQELSSQLQRRSTDVSAKTASGIITLATK